MSDSVLDIVNNMVEEGLFEKVLTKDELMYERKIWNSDILIHGGISYCYPEQLVGRDLDLKRCYRVAMTYKGRFNEEQHTKKLKFRVRLANDEIFSVAAKTSKEAQAVVDELFGKGHYKVSTMLE